MKEQPAYYANIPASVRYDKSLPANAKLLYGEITALCNKEGYCWASNKYFADLYGVATGTISEWVRKLRDCGHIDYTIKENNHRQVFLKGVSGNPEGGIRKSRRGVSGNPEHNTTENNTSNTTTTTEHSSGEIVAVIDAFKEWNPAANRWYARKPYRQAIDRLLKQCSQDQLCRLIATLPKTNQTRYFPTITTPLQLEDKWSQLEAAHVRYKEDNQVNVVW